METSKSLIVLYTHTYSPLKSIFNDVFKCPSIESHDALVDVDHSNKDDHAS